MRGRLVVEKLWHGRGYAPLDKLIKLSRKYLHEPRKEKL